MKINRFVWGVGGSILLMAVLFFIFLPPINPTSLTFWIFLWVGLSPLLLCCSTGLTINKKSQIDKYVIAGFGVTVVGVMILTIISSSVFHADEYSKRINLVDSSFDEIHEVDFTKTAIIDRESTLVLGDRTLGQLPELISQFEVSEIYSQISYSDTIVRVTPLDYNGWFKYFTNQGGGIPAYIVVNATSGKSDLIKLEDLGLKGMKYSVNAMFFQDRDRHMRFGYPTEVFGETNFEIDEEGTPYWVTSTVGYKGINQKATIEGVIVMNAITGEMQKYEVGAIPEWIDRVYPSSLVIEQVNQSGAYVNGFINSIIGQRDVYKTTEGYNYIELNDDIWIYTGITSANADESNIGFVLVNQRTQEAKKIMSAGAEEFSAMRSAEGTVQHLGYTSTFPLLISVGGRPTYLVSLKDNAGLIKMYAMIDCVDYQQVVTADKEKGLDYLKSQYISAMNIVDESKTIDKIITISEITTMNIAGDSYVFIKDETGDVYKIKVTLNEALVPFIKVNDLIEVKATTGEVNMVMDVKKVEKGE